MDKPIVTHWYEGKYGPARKVLAIDQDGHAYRVRCRTSRGVLNSYHEWHWLTWVKKDLGTKLPDDYESVRQRDAREHAAFPLLVAGLEACIAQIEALCSPGDVPDCAREALAAATAKTRRGK